MTKDIILIIGGGGMSGIFSSGVLKSFEKNKIYNRVHSVYSISVGGCTGARFLVKQSELAGRTFYTRFNDERFIKGNFIRYFIQVLRHKRDSKHKIKDVLDFDYFTRIILDSKDKINMNKVLESKIPFYVKVFNKTKNTNEYILIAEPDAYNKVIASASMTPLVSRSFKIDNEELFDGGTIPTNLESDIIKNNKDKIIIKINNYKYSWFSDFNIFKLIILYILFRAMHGSKVSNLYIKNSLKKIFWNEKFKKYDNLILITNEISISSFCKDTKKLKKVYNAGVKKGSNAERLIYQKLRI